MEAERIPKYRPTHNKKLHYNQNPRRLQPSRRERLDDKGKALRALAPTWSRTSNLLPRPNCPVQGQQPSLEISQEKKRMKKAPASVQTPCLKYCVCQSAYYFVCPPTNRRLLAHTTIPARKERVDDRKHKSTNILTPLCWLAREKKKNSPRSSRPRQTRRGRCLGAQPERRRRGPQQRRQQPPGEGEELGLSQHHGEGRDVKLTVSGDVRHVLRGMRNETPGEARESVLYRRRVFRSVTMIRNNQSARRLVNL